VADDQEKTEVLFSLNEKATYHFFYAQVTMTSKAQSKIDCGCFFWEI